MNAQDKLMCQVMGRFWGHAAVPLWVNYSSILLYMAYHSLYYSLIEVILQFVIPYYGPITVYFGSHDLTLETY